ncbi:RDD family protein [Solimonas flava]|uniref:RDD family protein n=1 Tax=Solimonas flava TaxID=415849 RepID=UPI0003F53D51|nr:RDD family protein [Solimonas flava]
MPDFLSPAPLWRRLLAAVYDSLLLVGLWMAALLAEMLVRDALGTERHWAVLRAYLFVVGLVFFVWFWTHGGQTLGMRAWRLQLRAGDDRPPSWLQAGVRYAVMLAVWGVVLTPPLARLPHLRELPHAGLASLAGAALSALALLAMLADRHRRAPQDWISGTHVVTLPKAGRSAG